jgi:single-stranded-DNA-specific exonuclease
VVPLTGVNRAIVTQGLKVMSAWSRPGMAALGGRCGRYRAGLALSCGLPAGAADQCGRTRGQSDLGARLMMTTDPAEAAHIAQTLDALNAERRAIEADVLDGRRPRSKRNPSQRTRPILIASGDHWHPGVIGIVAGRIKERFNRPAIVIGIDPETGLGKGVRPILRRRQSGRRGCSGARSGTAGSGRRSRHGLRPDDPGVANR